MSLLNATTSIEAERTIAEIQKLLALKGVTSFTVTFEDGEASGLKFAFKGENYHLPCRIDPIHKNLYRDPVLRSKHRTAAQARRVGWRIIRSWLLAQFAIIETGMTQLDEVMLPYLEVMPGKTLYETYRENRAERLLEQKG